jgi:hypothetical protein
MRAKSPPRISTRSQNAERHSRAASRWVSDASINVQSASVNWSNSRSLKIPVPPPQIQKPERLPSIVWQRGDHAIDHVFQARNPRQAWFYVMGARHDAWARVIRRRMKSVQASI